LLLRNLTGLQGLGVDPTKADDIIGAEKEKREKRRERK